MPEIRLTTKIAAPIERCFDAARSVDLHLASAAETGEKAVAGRLSGLCELGDEITWQARHFSITQRLSVRITDMEPPRYFVDEMTRGAFKSMRHEHRFEAIAGQTIMHDRFIYQVPFGILGTVFDVFVLKRHMVKFLMQRNAHLKSYCENTPHG